MTRKTRLIALVGFICLMVGLCLGTIGFLSNGLEALTDLNKPVKKEVTVDKISSLNIELFDHAITIKESKDDKVHVAYQQFQDKDQSHIIVKNKNGQLSITEKWEHFTHIQLPLQAISRELSNSKYRAHTITLYLPKNMTLDKLSGFHHLGHALSLTHLQIKDFQYQGYVYADNVSIEGGEISSGDFTNSHIKNAKLHANGLSLEHSTIENSQIDIQQWVNFTDTIFKNTKLNAEYATHDLDFEGITLDNSSLKAYNYSLVLKDLTVRGNSDIKLLANDNFDGIEEDLTISLASDSKDKINLDLSVTEPYTIKTKTLANISKTDQKASRTVTDSKDTLTVTSQIGNISID